jgi:hypothetical protein
MRSSEDAKVYEERVTWTFIVVLVGLFGWGAGRFVPRAPDPAPPPDAGLVAKLNDVVRRVDDLEGRRCVRAEKFDLTIYNTPDLSKHAPRRAALAAGKGE